jgi:hypothetical protein
MAKRILRRSRLKKKLPKELINWNKVTISGVKQSNKARQGRKRVIKRVRKSYQIYTKTVTRMKKWSYQKELKILNQVLERVENDYKIT